VELPSRTVEQVDAAHEERELRPRPPRDAAPVRPQTDAAGAVEGDDEELRRPQRRRNRLGSRPLNRARHDLLPDDVRAVARLRHCKPHRHACGRDEEHDRDAHAPIVRALGSVTVERGCNRLTHVKVMVATDRSETARQAVEWAAELARGFGAELVLLQVLLEPEEGSEERLQEDARALDGARAVLRVDPDVAGAIVRASEEEDADVLVVGNAGMGGRTEFLLGNVPNRISHAARCTVVIVNTTDGAVPEPVPEAVEEGGLLGRAGQIGRVLTRFGLDARKAASPADRARRMREALEELGPTFAKLGQILSTRPDLVTPEVTEELAKLQDDVSPLTEEEVVRVMEQELRVPWEDVFESIEPTPLAAGTIGQVHRATLEGGERVIVKVQRPRARAEITRDLGLLELFAEKALGRDALRGAVDIPAL